ncbi:MAG: phosphate ABC transporter substrate-binding protein PstS [Synergistetes bacterium]|nr:phosphate ABC transporter substrate-binding protein PstS [Synergistota bacterium]
MRKVLAIVIFVMLLITMPAFAKEIELTGAGATFPYPFYSKLFSIYSQKMGIKINYQAIGSGGGIRQLLNKTVDFGATDAPMSDKELKEAGSPIAHIPTCLGAIVITYNLPGNPKLKLTGEILADIFLGKIGKWNDPRIKEINPDIKLPNMNITVIHRSDGSGSTFILSKFLSKVSGEWKKKVGVGKALRWPTGLGGKGNPGVAGLIRQIPGSLGYVELVYALQSKMPFASIKNASGKFIEPSIESVSASAQTDIPADTRVDLTDTKAPDGYPLSSFTWIIVYKEQKYNDRTKERAEELVKLLWWIIHDGQKHAPELSYSPLPESAIKVAESVIKSITYEGNPILK